MVIASHVSLSSQRFFFLVLTFLLILGIIYLLFPRPDHPNPIQIIASDDDFTVTAEYQGSENWNYVVTGVLPNSCITHDTAAEVIASNPQEVNVTLFLYSPDDQSLCAQRAQELQIEGTFTAKSDQRLSFKVNNQVSKETPTGLPKKNS